MKAINHTKGNNQVRRKVVDGGVLTFDRGSGTNVLLQNASTFGLVRSAPRVLQIGLVSQCNLHCEYCYCRNESANRLDNKFLVELLRRAADWGVLEVAFGGGEPLMYPGFLELIQRLRQETSLGVNLTTNGTLLSRDVVAQFTPDIGEIRISAHRGSHYRRTLQMLAGHNVGVNWLVTPSNVGLIEPYVHDFLALGARNILLLGYKGEDSSLHLQPGHLETLKRAVLRLQALPLRLDGCWYPHLTDLPHLFPKQDCGAGDEFMVITPDRAVQPCSFHCAKIPFETVEELQEIYTRFRAERKRAEIPGCTRHLFATGTTAIRPRVTTAWIWQARASNNSGDWTIVGRFQSVDEAQNAAAGLRELARAHEAFLAGPEGQEWLKRNNYMGHIPSPPLRLFGESHGFDWSGQDDGLWWEEDGCGAPVLTAGAVGASIVVYHPYCMGLPERPFKEFFANVGAFEFGYWQYDRPLIVASAQGDNPAAMKTLQDYFSTVAAAKYPGEVEAPPPWGDKCQDPRVQEDEDQSARLASGVAEMRQEGDRLHLQMAFENTFAGSLALENWLTAIGYKEITIEIENKLHPLDTAGQTKTTPKLGLFGDVRPLKARLIGVPSEKAVELAFAYHGHRPEELTKALNAIPPVVRLNLCWQRWEQSRQSGRDVTLQALLIIEELGSIAASWMRCVWHDVAEKSREYWGFATKALAASLPPEEAVDLAKAWAEKAGSREDKKARLMALGNIASRHTLGLIKQWWASAEPGSPVTEDWGRLAAQSQLNWATAKEWIRVGRPLALIALDALANYLPRGGHPHMPPLNDFGLDNTDAFLAVLSEYRSRDSSPRVDRAVGHLIKNAEAFLH